ncbi:AraC family transcriptional regulator [Nocardioides euryhalodurans]|uniref:AraC family transcriptional regulator n=1 Tax=Nocardioides euryhalodurans TaxID=2518370 RepID=A0A4P7GM48_9ACTN|nr:AraC family transcriptional regulator [Nocardioides euryhalodurans]QBR92969.1 AraC family transcriptional regulator [Nocardioides euryhalodurans]
MERDLLSETLTDFGMTGVFYAASELAAPWGIALPPMPGTIVFHLVTDGELVLDVDGETTRMTAGDIVLVPHGTGHAITDAPGSRTTPLFDLPRDEVGERYERLRIPGPGPRTELVCGAVSFTGVGVARLLRSLPAVLPAGRGEDAAWMRAAFEVIGAESRQSRPGSDVVTARLADILVVQVVRSWLESATPDRGWLAGLRDPLLGRALAAFHAEPGAPWTLASLAGEAGMSRSAFAARFSDRLGEPPMAYVTAWRMDLAARLVREEALPLARVAERVGYQSEAAFNRAFRRAHGVTPGAFARRGPAFLDLVPGPAAL